MSFTQNNFNQNNLNKNSLKHLLIQNLNKLIDNESLNKKQIQTGGGKKYTQTELDNLVQQTVQYIGALFFQSQSDKSIIRNKIESLLREKPYLFDMMDKLEYNMKPFEYVYKQTQTQYGGSKKKYSQQQLDLEINNSVQQFLAQYIQSESEKQFFTNIYAKLVELSDINPFVQFGKIVSLNIGKIANSNTNKMPTHVSLKTLINHLIDTTNKMYESNKAITNIKLLSNENYELSYSSSNKYFVKILVDPTTMATADISKLNAELSNIFKNVGVGRHIITNTTNQNYTKTDLDLNDNVRKFLNNLEFSDIHIEKTKVNPDDLLGIIKDKNIKIGRGSNAKNGTISNFIGSNQNIKTAYELIEKRISNIITTGGLPKTLN
jgi:hypothetical protein